ncbi:CDP-diacylglycerol--glycerol-3-phosphate 3-phosphatidyltransferase [Palleronia caenipelagi]|uniref:CDP-diacylglycerol--glycerol-3-phosphate 3-phosphatidyltransferase n=1 Tax=Palleronia caenipelagi TaxID=2489174 RepID=A0A547Q8R2_9RHOB|nr:CDP-diacylglycerol--glycerol-3-phosphate 3-phosphatidyltransferase [Palleronia caenipelagi]TRD22758.1 CDP-diacylglycerol--glycerol-3-phosphate 3-phosphatidyltransferase [Palleronia caenipelagi]
MRWTLPNILTVIRLIAAPAVALVFVIFDRPAADWLGFALFVGASVTDWFDGYIARAWNLESRFGAMLDPIADKAMVIISLMMLGGLSGLSGWVLVPAALIVFREVFVSGLREFLGADAKLLKVTKLAKWKTTVQMVAIAVLFASGALGGAVFAAGAALLWAAAALTLITGWDYFSKALPYVKDPV